MDNHLIDLTGQDFGFWHVLKQAPRQDNKTRWLCECRTCGMQRTKRSVQLRRGKYTKCFGKHAIRERQGSPSWLTKPSGYAAETETYGHYKLTAKRRGFSFSLTRDEFHQITQQDCHYCGAPPSQSHSRRHFNGAFIYNGIDRRDSSFGYEPDNCLPCCGPCNVMKQDLPYQAFLNHIARIYARVASDRSDPAAPHIKMTLGTFQGIRTANIEPR